MKFAINVTKPGRSLLTNAYTSVLSTAGSAAISGASRWLDARAPPGPRTAAPAATASPSAASAVLRRRVFVVRICSSLGGTCAGLGSAVPHGRMGGCEISLTDPSAAPLAPNTPTLTITPGDRAGSDGPGANLACAAPSLSGLLP